MKFRWSWPRFFIILTVIVLLGGIAFLIFAVHSRKRTFEYLFQVDAVMTAATVANNGELIQDPALSVVSEWQGERWYVHPANYTAISSYIKRDAAMPLFFHMNEDEVLTITCCNDAVFRIAPSNDEGDAVDIELKTGGQTFRIHARGGILWPALLECSTRGTYHDQNLPVN